MSAETLVDEIIMKVEIDSESTLKILIIFQEIPMLCIKNREEDM